MKFTSMLINISMLTIRAVYISVFINQYFKLVYSHIIDLQRSFSIHTSESLKADIQSFVVLIYL